MKDEAKQLCYHVAVWMAREANRCCGRSDGFEESLRDRALVKLIDCVKASTKGHTAQLDLANSRILALECAIRWMLEYSPESVPKHVQDILHDTMEE